MLDINLIRENPDLVRVALKNRQEDSAPVDRVLELDAQRRDLIQAVETLKAERNAGSKEISRTKDSEARQAKIEAMRAVGDKISNIDEELRDAQASL
ncbi:MAG: serine--tRNA ligase, partial [Chloroflexi bacterium]|nr:serine--tRNA ligase [Chloroflexota bacterium]